MSYFFVRFFCPGTSSPCVFLILDVIWLSIGSCLVSAAILSKDKTSVSTKCKNVSSNSSVLSFDSLKNHNLDIESTCGIEFSLTYSISKSNTINLIAYLCILDVVTLDNSFLGLNINFNGLWSLLKNFFPIKICQALMVVHTMANASFSIFK